jgi:hypothetical protein
LHAPDGEKRGGADAASFGGAAGDAGRCALLKIYGYTKQFRDHGLAKRR